MKETSRDAFVGMINTNNLRNLMKTIHFNEISPC